MKFILKLTLPVLLFSLLPSLALAHHNTQAEYGAFGSPYLTVDGIIREIRWGNPHIQIDIEVTGGDLPAGENGKTWTINSHPINVMTAYGFRKDEFSVGDKVHLLAWRHVRGISQLWPRAIRINGGPLKSNLRFTDMIDIANGTFLAKGIQPAANLNGSPPERAGAATVKKLEEMGLLDDNGKMIWPPPAAH